MNPRIENWSVRPINPSLYMPPEQQGQCICGQVYGHPGFSEGHEIATSQIVEVNGKTVRTRHNTYELGQIDPKYLEWCQTTEGVRVPTEGDWIRVHV